MKKKVIFIIISLLIIIYFRTPQIITHGRFWAEEGSVYFSEAYNNTSWHIFLSSNLGYYSLFNKVVMLIGVSLFDLKYIPIVTVAFSIIVIIAVAIILLLSEIKELNRIIYKVILLSILIFIQPNHEVWLNTINSQFYLLIGTAIILISYTNSIGLNIFRLGVLIVSGFTGAASCFLTPLFFIKWHCEKNKINFLELIIITGCTLIQLFVIALNNQRGLTINLVHFPLIMFIKQILLPIFGTDFTNSAAIIISNNFVIYGLFTYWLIILMIVYYIFVVVIVNAKSKNALILFISSICVALLSYMGSLGNIKDTTFLNQISYSAERYYFAPNVLFFMALVIVLPIYLKRFLNTKKIINIIILIFCLIYLELGILTGVKDYFFTKNNNYFSGPNWQEEISKWHKDTEYKVKIWPKGWKLDLNKK